MNIPVVDLIHLDRSTESGFYPYWHTTHDNLASIDANTLKAVGQTMLTVAYEEQ
jgi:aminopeptidase-like protein